jgi:hypothetical protein
VIMGRLIPAGTGLSGYLGLGIQVEVPEGFEFETAEPGNFSAEGNLDPFGSASVIGDEDAPVAGLFGGAPPAGGGLEG